MTLIEHLGIPSRKTVEPGTPPDPKNVSVQFPEGGFRSWLVVMGAFCISFSTFGYMNAYGVFQDYYSSHFLSQRSSFDISWIGSIQVFFLYAGGVVGGPLFDRYGARIIHIPVIVVVFSIMMTSLCTKYYQFMLAQGILFGLASGMLFAPIMTCVSHYFQRRRAVALGITVTGSSTGGVVFPIALGKMLQNEALGFGWSVRIVGFIILAMMLIAMLTLKERLPPRRGPILLPSAFSRPAYILATLSIFFMTWGLFTPFFYLPQYATTKHMSSDLTFYLPAVLNATSVFGRVLPGLVADKMGRFNTLIVQGSCTGILLLCWPAAVSNAAVFVFAALYGFFSGGIVSLMSPCIAQVTPQPNQIGTYLGMAMAIFGIAGLTGTPICGALIQAYDSYWQPAIFSGVVVLFGALLTAVARFYLSRQLLAKV